MAAGARVAVFAGAHFGADALAAVHAVREAGGVLAAVAVVAALTTTFCALSDNFYSFRASFSHEKTKLVTSQVWPQQFLDMADRDLLQNSLNKLKFNLIK